MNVRSLGILITFLRFVSAGHVAVGLLRTSQNQSVSSFFVTARND
jgi:hypothetical protein